MSLFLNNKCTSWQKIKELFVKHSFSAAASQDWAQRTPRTVIVILVNNCKVCLSPSPKFCPPHGSSGSAFQAEHFRNLTCRAGEPGSRLRFRFFLLQAGTYDASSLQLAIGHCFSPHTLILIQLSKRKKKEKEFTANNNTIKSRILQGLHFPWARKTSPR